jgi:hypothetical protein
MYHLRRCTIASVAIAAVVFVFWLLPRVLNPTPPDKQEREANDRWIDTSPYWLDRQACRWLGLCGILHLKYDAPARRDKSHDDRGDLRSLELRSKGEQVDPAWEIQQEDTGAPARADHGGELRGIPDYVLKYAPLVHLYSGEHFWPSDIADHVAHMAPYVDETPLNASIPLNLQSLHRLDAETGSVYLKSEDDVESRPDWLHSSANIPVAYDDEDEGILLPDNSGKTHRHSESTTWFEVDRDHPLRRISDPRERVSRLPPPYSVPKSGRLRQAPGGRRLVPPTPQHKPDDSGYSKAPATLVLVDKGSGVVDAFWFFFYAYNLGQTVLGVRFGNHVGDWEHTMIRFESGVPRAVFFSEHAGGQAYAWNAVEKRGNVTAQRPVIYSAVGSHAMYAMPGNHPYVLPFSMLKDVTDRGPLWDPARNLRGYWYDYTVTKDAEGLEPVKENPDAPTDWFHYQGPWGDKFYRLDDTRQWRFFGQYHYVTGPRGPKFKNLGRERVCQNWRCRILQSIAEGRKASWHS